MRWATICQDRETTQVSRSEILWLSALRRERSTKTKWCSLPWKRSALATILLYLQVQLPTSCQIHARLKIQSWRWQVTKVWLGVSCKNSSSLLIQVLVSTTQGIIKPLEAPSWKVAELLLTLRSDITTWIRQFEELKQWSNQDYLTLTIKVSTPPSFRSN